MIVYFSLTQLKNVSYTWQYHSSKVEWTNGPFSQTVSSRVKSLPVPVILTFYLTWVVFMSVATPAWYQCLLTGLVVSKSNGHIINVMSCAWVIPAVKRVYIHAHCVNAP